MVKRKRRRVLKNQSNRKDALTWLMLGILVGGILVFTLITPARLMYSPGEIDSGCGIYRTDDLEVSNCYEKCSYMGKKCLFGQEESSLRSCYYRSDDLNLLYCVCCE